MIAFSISDDKDGLQNSDEVMFDLIIHFNCYTSMFKDTKIKLHSRQIIEENVQIKDVYFLESGIKQRAR